MTDKQIKALSTLALYEGRSKGAVMRRLLEQHVENIDLDVEIIMKSVISPPRGAGGK